MSALRYCYKNQATQTPLQSNVLSITLHSQTFLCFLVSSGNCQYSTNTLTLLVVSTGDTMTSHVPSSMVCSFVHV